MNSVISLLITFLLFSFIHCSSTPPVKPSTLKTGDYTYAKEYIRYLLNSKRKEIGSAGLSMVVVSGDDVIFNEGSGFADIDSKKEITDKTIFYIGSISKVFTAIAIQQLAESGKLNLDQPVNKYLPELKIKTRFKDARPYTVRDLLMHHSGLPADRMKGWLQESITEEGQREYLQLSSELSEEYTARPPGRMAAYSNLSYSLLGVIVSKVSGKPFPQYIQENILKPLDMNDSGFEYKDYGSEMSKGYRFGKEVPDMIIRDLSAGSFRSSGRSLSNFIKMLNNGGSLGKTKILKNASFKEMITPHNSSAPLDIDFKIGHCFWLFSDTKTGMELAGHGGDVPPFHALLVFSPEHKIGVIVAGNTDGVGSFGFSDLVTEAIRITAETKLGSLPQKENPTPIEIKEEDAKKKAATYVMGSGISEVTASGNSLKLEIMGTVVNLKPLSDGTFGMQYKLLGLFPIPIPQLASMKVKFKEIEGTKYFTILSSGIGLGIAGMIGQEWKFHPIHSEWKNRIGKYSFLNQDKRSMLEEMEIIESNGILLTKVTLNIGIKQHLSVPLITLSSTEAITAGEGRNAGETIQSKTENGEEILLYSGYKLRKEK